mmetsp:Transcript_34519/g.103146  ORF Transcript_34519/g.103146 Transcript_34519/m.103146 type:complete len:365 (+) Transcript_34519:268-1362(+)
MRRHRHSLRGVPLLRPRGRSPSLGGGGLQRALGIEHDPRPALCAVGDHADGSHQRQLRFVPPGGQCALLGLRLSHHGDDPPAGLSRHLPGHHGGAPADTAGDAWAERLHPGRKGLGVQRARLRASRAVAAAADERRLLSRRGGLLQRPGILRAVLAADGCGEGARDRARGGRVALLRHWGVHGAAAGVRGGGRRRQGGSRRQAKRWLRGVEREGQRPGRAQRERLVPARLLREARTQWGNHAALRPAALDHRGRGPPRRRPALPPRGRGPPVRRARPVRGGRAARQHGHAHLGLLLRRPGGRRRCGRHGPGRVRRRARAARGGPHLPGQGQAGCLRGPAADVLDMRILREPTCRNLRRLRPTSA